MKKQISIGIVLQYIQLSLSIVVSLLYTPYMIKILGQSEYGLYNLSSSIISYLSLISLGLGSSYLRFYFMQRKNNPEKVKSLNGLYFLMFSIIGIIALIAGFVLSQNVSLFFNETYSSSDKRIASVLMIFLTINLAISLPMNVFVGYVMSQEKFIFLKLINIVKTVLSPAISIVALLLGYGSIGLVFISTAISIVADIINIFYCFKVLKMPFSFKKMDLSLVKPIFVFSIFIAINQLVDQINWQTDKVLLGKMISSVAVSIYAIGATFNNYFMMFGTSVSSVFVPGVNAIVQSDFDEKVINAKLTELMIKVGRLQFMVLGLVLSGFIIFGQTFIRLWVGSDFDLSYFVAILLMVPLLPDLLMTLGIEVQKAKNLHKFRSFLYLGMAIVNVGISILLVKALGIIGAALGTSISFVLINDIVMTIYYHKKVKIDMVKFWISILKMFTCLIFPVVLGIGLNRLLPKTLSMFIVGLIIYTIMYVISLYFLGMNESEKSAFSNFLKKIKMNKDKKQ